MSERWPAALPGRQRDGLVGDVAGLGCCAWGIKQNDHSQLFPVPTSGERARKRHPPIPNPPLGCSKVFKAPEPKAVPYLSSCGSCWLCMRGRSRAGGRFGPPDRLLAIAHASVLESHQVDKADPANKTPCAHMCRWLAPAGRLLHSEVVSN